MNVVFRVDASISMGSGHVMRCLTLAEGLREQGAEVLFVCRELSGNLNAMIAAKEGEYSALAELNELCVGCGRCESACPENIPIISMISEAAHDDLINESFPIRVGRGAIQDVEIRKVGQPIVFGEIPGVVAMVGCSNYPAGYGDVAEITEEISLNYLGLIK